MHNKIRQTETINLSYPINKSEMPALWREAKQE